MKWYPRACPVCRGDLYEEIQGPDLHCLMCGREFLESVIRRRPVAVEERPGRPALLASVAESAWYGLAARSAAPRYAKPRARRAPKVGRAA